MPKRLKSLDECGNVSIADSRKVNRILDEKAKDSATYNHNKMIFDETSKSNIIPLKKRKHSLRNFIVSVLVIFLILMIIKNIA